MLYHRGEWRPTGTGRPAIRGGESALTRLESDAAYSAGFLPRPLLRRGTSATSRLSFADLVRFTTTFSGSIARCLAITSIISSLMSSIKPGEIASRSWVNTICRRVLATVLLGSSFLNRRLSQFMRVSSHYTAGDLLTVR